MAPETALVLKLQGLDQRIIELKKEIAELPKRIATIEKQLELFSRRLEADRAALVANQRDRKKLEGDVQMQQQKISKIRDQLLQAKTNEQYRAFQNEITFCEDQIRKFEDKILELMSECDPLEKAVKLSEQKLKEDRARIEAEKRDAESRTAVDQKELAVCEGERKQVAAETPALALKTYERIFKRIGATAVAEVMEERCTGCQMVLRPQAFQDLKLSTSLMTCESCNRILFYNPPVVVDEQGTAPVAE